MAAPIPDLTIRLKLREPLLTVSGLPAARAWENRSFVPPNPPDTWIRETYLPGVEQRRAHALVALTGIVQFDVFVPKGDGTETAEALTDKIKDVYQATPTIAVGNGHSIRVVGASRLPSIPENIWAGFPVQVQFLVHGTLPLV